mgnify:FL=1
MKKIYVTKPFMPPYEEYEKYLKKIWHSQVLTNKGPLSKKFEQSLEKYLQADNVLLTVNGHSALDIAIKSLNLSGEVITTPFTFASSTHALVLNDLKPVFCDIKESDLTIDEDKIEELITDKTSAILAVHVYGHSCNVKKIEKIAKKHHLKVIYDAAHTFGVNSNGNSILNQGDISICSFHATKLFHTIEGGCIVYQDRELTPLINAYRNFGIYSEEEINYVGGNAKMNEFQAAMGLTNLKYIKKIIQKRKELTLYYRNLLDSIDGIKYFLPEDGNDYQYNYAYLPVLIKKEILGISRDELYEKLKKFNIFSRKYFYPLITDYGCYKNDYGDANIPVARKIAEEVLCLPLYYSLSLEEIDYIINCIEKIVKMKGK